MEREIDGGDRDAGRRARRIQHFELLHRLGRGVERAPACLIPIRFFEGEGGEHAVANEFEHLAAACAERQSQNLEDVVERVDDDGTRRGVANRGKAADIGIPNDRAELLDGTALDRAGMDAPSGVLAEIGRQQTRATPVGRGSRGPEPVVRRRAAIPGRRDRPRPLQSDFDERADLEELQPDSVRSPRRIGCGRAMACRHALSSPAKAPAESPARASYRRR